jgi:NCAIR mutase (PurE)-related protein
MQENRLREMLEELEQGRMTVDEIIEGLRRLPFEDMGFAKIDHHRSLRRGFPEVIFCEGKSPDEIVKIATGMIEQGADLLATRCSPELFAEVKADIAEAVYDEKARLFTVQQTGRRRRGRVAVVSGGTSDRQVAEEAALTADFFGCNVDRLYDVGVAGIHRLFNSWDKVRGVDAIIVVAGMEGALASVVAGIADAPIIAVPTSVGYGASFGGISALLTMLNSCAGGVTVVNIDNGFGAGYAAAVICRKIYDKKGAPKSKRKTKAKTRKRGRGSRA